MKLKYVRTGVLCFVLMKRSRDACKSGVDCNFFCGKATTFLIAINPPAKYFCGPLQDCFRAKKAICLVMRGWTLWLVISTERSVREYRDP